MSSKTKHGAPSETTPEEAQAILKAEAERKQQSCASEIDMVLAKYGMTISPVIGLTPDGRIMVQAINIVPKIG